MGLIQFIVARRHASCQQQVFQRICQANQLRLERVGNLPDLATLQEVFEERAYADYFPFYQAATVVDIGAHKGYFSLFALKNLAANARIVAVEPYAANREQLQQNLEANGGGHVQCVALGLGPSTGEGTLYLGRSENHSLFQQHSRLLQGPDGGGTAAVSLRTLKDFLAEQHLAQVDFCKFDCEGAEYPAILGADRETLQKIRTISMEFHDLRDPRYTALSLAGHLQANGFRIVKLQHGASLINNNYGKLIACRDD